MSKIVLIACVKEKLSQRAKAKDLYISSLFKFSYKYANLLNPDKIFILSAKYYLLDLEREIETYDETLSTKPSKEIKKWANKVIGQLNEVTDLNRDDFVFLAGLDYRKYLIPHIIHYSVPMEGLRQGEQLRYLKERTSNDRKLL